MPSHTFLCCKENFADPEPGPTRRNNVVNASTASRKTIRRDLSPDRIFTNGEQDLGICVERRRRESNPQEPLDSVIYKITGLASCRTSPHRWGSGSVLSDFSVATARRSRNHELPPPSNRARVAPGQTRTGDLPIRRGRSFQLSYGRDSRTGKT